MVADKNTPPGPAVDSSGQSVVDPTRNVERLFEAGMQRQDDLRECEATWQRRMNKAESKHLREMMDLRATHSREARSDESERLDAIRNVDVGAVASAAVVQQTAANTLAAQVATQAEALRSQVAAAATVTATALDSKIAPIQKDIADLRQVQYEAAGGKAQVSEARDAVADMKPLLDAVERLSQAQEQRIGQQSQVVQSQARSSNVGLWVGIAAAAFVGLGGMTLTVLGVGVTLYLALR